MAAQKQQNFQNHTRLVPPFHMFVLPVLLVNVGWTIYHLVKIGISFESVFGIVLAVTRIVSVSSILAALTAIVLVCAFAQPLPYRLLVITGGI